MMDQEKMRDISAELLERLSTEEMRAPEVPSTQLVGGMVKAGAKLEAFLREVVVQAAAAEGVVPEAMLSTLGGKGGPKPDLRKAMAGPLAHGLRSYFTGRAPDTIPAPVRSIVVDLLSPSPGSRILHFIAVRNVIAKEGKDPALGREPTQALRQLIEHFREEAGWR